MFLARARLLLVAALTVAAAAHAQDVPLDKQKGVRGRIVVAPELLTSPTRLSAERERVIKSSAIVRRPLGRKQSAILEPAPPLVVMLEGEGLRSEPPPPPKLVVGGMRFRPGSIVMPRPMNVQVENRQSHPITIVDASGAVRTVVAPGEVGEVPLGKADLWSLAIEEMPWATAEVRVLDRGRVLPLNDGEIPLVDIPGGNYQLTFFFGAEPLRIQPLTVPDLGVIFIDATVSALKVVEVSVKDASMRIAVPVGLREPRDTQDGSP